jgi:hypothetical protein
MDLTEKTDRELMVMKVDMASALSQLQRQMQIVDAEIMRRVKEEKEKLQGDHS